jgi:uncharacterized protein
MEKQIYSLKMLEHSSDSYYKEIREFTNEVVDRSMGSISSLINAYKTYLIEEQNEQELEYEEYLLDFLSMGVFWKSYSKTALSVIYAPYDTLALMSHWRKRSQLLKPAIDFTRGVCFTLLMLPKISVNGEYQYPKKHTFNQFLKWLAATGEYNEQILRLRKFEIFITSLTSGEAGYIFKEIIDFADWFEQVSLDNLGKFTQNVDEFLGTCHEKFRWREDRIQCSAPRLEYHYNMLGAELMNRAFRREFNQTQETVILLPGCMRRHHNERCKASPKAKGHICRGCEKNCEVNQLRKLGLEQNFKCYIIPHSSDLSQWATSDNDQKLGVIASACVTSLVEGGLELRRYGVPAQCVLLDYSGCQKHWHPEGVTTELNLNEMTRILERE